MDKPKSTGKFFYLFNYTRNGEDTFYTFAFYADTIETARARFADLVKPQNGDSWQEFRITGLTQEGCHGGNKAFNENNGVVNAIL